MDDLTVTRTVALAWANQVRGQYTIGPSLEALPPGTQNTACLCPLAKAIGGGCAVLHNEVILHFQDTDTEELSVCMPFIVAEFVQNFDAGLYPDLIA